MSKVKIYTLTDPRTNEIRYVGKTKYSLNKRLNSHLSDCKRYNFHNANWLKVLLSNNLKPSISLLEEVIEDNWIERERYWIKYYRELGCNLNNNTDGGEGHLGYKKSEELKERISQWSRGKQISQKQKEQISKANKGKKHSLEFRKNISKKKSKSCYLYNSITNELLFFSNLRELSLFFGLKGFSIGYKLESKNYLKPYKKIFYILKNKEDLIYVDALGCIA